MRKEITVPIYDFVLFDIETKGLDYRTERITEISALKVRKGQVVNIFTTFVNPGKRISPFITNLTGITNAMVADAPFEKDAVSAFLEFTGDLPLAGHNIKRFDFGFIDRVCKDELGISVDNDFIDSLTLAKRRLPDLSSRSLGSLAEYYGVSYEGAHRAEADCRINLEVMLRLFSEEEKPRGKRRICPECGHEMVKRTSRYGEFWGCTGYPSCRHTERI